MMLNIDGATHLPLGPSARQILEQRKQKRREMRRLMRRQIRYYRKLATRLPRDDLHGW